MRVVFINRFYWPETPATGQLLTDLAESTAQDGHHVTVITSHSGAAGLPTTEDRHGVHICRVRGTRWTKAGLLGKAADWVTFYFRALWRLLRVATRGTTIVAMTDPPLLGIGAWLVAGLRGARLVHWVQDIYPELAIELAGQRWLRLFQPLRDRSWRHAESCVVIGHDMARNVATAGVEPSRHMIIPNWAPTGLTVQSRDRGSELRKAWHLDGKFVVAYSGNLGRVHDLEVILDVADALRERRDIAFIFVGRGAQRAALEETATRLGLANVSFHDPQSRTKLTSSLALPDVHLVTLRSGCERLVFPSKLYGVAAVGRPMIFIGPHSCEVARVTREHGMGDTAERHEVSRIVACICRLEADNEEWTRRSAAAARFATTHDFTQAADRWREILKPLHACGTPEATVTTKSD